MGVGVNDRRLDHLDIQLKNFRARDPHHPQTTAKDSRLMAMSKKQLGTHVVGLEDAGEGLGFRSAMIMGSCPLYR
jgi:hypothetical protein